MWEILCFKASLMDRVKKLEILLEFGKKIQAERNIEKLIKLLTEEATELLEAERATVFVLDKEKKKLWSLVGLGLDKQKIEIPMNEGIAGYVATTGESLNVPNAYKDERFNKEIDKKTGFRTKTILAVPIRNLKGEIMGVFQVLNKKDTTFNEEDEEILNMLASQAGVAIENSKLYSQLKEAFSSFIESLAQALDARDHITSGHTLRVANLSMLIGKKLGLNEEEIEILHHAAWLHDIGKIGIKDSVLAKPGKLTEEEFNHIKTHTILTKQILDKIKFYGKMKDIPLIASSHHERYDGRGYNLGLKGTEIPLLSRIISVSDVFDALTSKRHYRDPMPILQVLEIIEDGKGKNFDPKIVEIFFTLSLFEILNVIKLGRKKLKLTPEEENLLKSINLKTFFSFLKKKQNTPFEMEVIETFNKIYLDNA